MIETLRPLLPIYGLIFLGFSTVRWRYIAAAGLPHIGQFTFKILLPVLIASAVSRAGHLGDFNWAWIVAYGAGSLSMLSLSYLLLTRRFGISPPAAWMLSLGAGMANSVFLGYPIVTIVLPDIADQVFAWLMTVENMVILPMGMTLASLADPDNRGATPGHTVARTLLNTLRSPIVVGLLAGFFLAATGIRLPWAVEQVRVAIVAGAPVLALFLVGGLVASAPKAQLFAPPMLVIVGLKLLVHPALTFALMRLLPGITLDQALGGTLFAAIPMMATFTVFAGRYGAERLAASALVISTALAAVTVSLLVLLIA